MLRRGRPPKHPPFDTLLAWLIYQQEGSLVITAEKLSEHLSIEYGQTFVIPKESVRIRLIAAGYKLNHRGSQKKAHALTDAERSKKYRAKQKVKNSL